MFGLCNNLNLHWYQLFLMFFIHFNILLYMLHLHLYNFLSLWDLYTSLVSYFWQWMNGLLLLLWTTQSFFILVFKELLLFIMLRSFMQFFPPALGAVLFFSIWFLCPVILRGIGFLRSNQLTLISESFKLEKKALHSWDEPESCLVLINYSNKSGIVTIICKSNWLGTKWTRHEN